nr:unnamed protein product [Callosobruchus chinensis]
MNAHSACTRRFLNQVSKDIY